MHSPPPEFVNPYSCGPFPASVGAQEKNCQRLEKLQDAFSRATGWAVQWFPEEPEHSTVGENTTPDRGGLADAYPFRLKPLAKKSAPYKGVPKGLPSVGTQEAVALLAEEVSKLLREIARLQRTLWEREAELATGVPVVAEPLDKRNWARNWAYRLQAVLRAGVEAVGADAAELYLLDDATTCLKLRSVWGLPIQKLAEPARALRGALADLEALLGHAVVLDDVARMPHWQVPESGFGAAVCVPVSTESTLLGTLWVFSKESRDFTPQQTNILEVIAGRIATELEREVLLAEAAAAQPWKEHLYQLERWHEEQPGWVVPCWEGWDIGLWKESHEAGWGELFQWFPWGDQWMGLAIGRVQEQGLRAVLEAVRVRSALQAHRSSTLQPHRLLQQTHQTLWASSVGDYRTSVWLGRLARQTGPHTADSQLIYASAGRMGLLLLTSKGWKSLSEKSMPLGQPTWVSEPLGDASSEEKTDCSKTMPTYRSRQRRLRRGEVLVIFPEREGVSDSQSLGSPPASPLQEIESRLAEHLRPHLHAPAPRLAELAQKFLQKAAREVGPLPKSLYVLKAR